METRVSMLERFLDPELVQNVEVIVKRQVGLALRRASMIDFDEVHDLQPAGESSPLDEAIDPPPGLGKGLVL